MVTMEEKMIKQQIRKIIDPFHRSHDYQRTEIFAANTGIETENDFRYKTHEALILQDSRSVNSIG
jgi:hypothetical protein